MKGVTVLDGEVLFHIVPAFYPAFRCKAGECRHSCCRGWEIDIDENTLSTYQCLPGARVFFKLCDSFRAIIRKYGFFRKELNGISQSVSDRAAVKAASDLIQRKCQEIFSHKGETCYCPVFLSVSIGKIAGELFEIILAVAMIHDSKIDAPEHILVFHSAKIEFF